MIISNSSSVGVLLFSNKKLWWFKEKAQKDWDKSLASLVVWYSIFIPFLPEKETYPEPKIFPFLSLSSKEL